MTFQELYQELLMGEVYGTTIREDIMRNRHHVPQLAGRIHNGTFSSYACL